MRDYCFHRCFLPQTLLDPVKPCPREKKEENRAPQNYCKLVAFRYCKFLVFPFLALSICCQLSAFPQLTDSSSNQGSINEAFFLDMPSRQCPDLENALHGTLLRRRAATLAPARVSFPACLLYSTVRGSNGLALRGCPQVH